MHVLVNQDSSLTNLYINVGVEAIYKFLFPREIFYQFWDTPFNDVSIGF